MEKFSSDISESPRTINYQTWLDLRLLERWAEEIPVYSENDPNDPEWKETRSRLLDLTSAGYGIVHVKDEGDKSSNPTGTIKDRAAWELVVLYRNFARALYMQMRQGQVTAHEISRMKIPRMSFITAGNEGNAVQHAFGKFQLPPPKLIVDRNSDILEKIETENWYADVYPTDLTQPLTKSDILEFTGNDEGIGIDSFVPLHPERVFYDWHVHEVFNQAPDFVFVPYGSGRLMENYLEWQKITAENATSGRRDPRLKIHPAKAYSINIMGSEPVECDSIAQKLTAHHKPFLLFKDEDISGERRLNFTGPETRRCRVPEAYIREAHKLMQQNGIAAEPSGAAGLALYLQQYDQGLIPDEKKVLVVNTGKGL